MSDSFANPPKNSWSRRAVAEARSPTASFIIVFLQIKSFLEKDTKIIFTKNKQKKPRLVPTITLLGKRVSCEPRMESRRRRVSFIVLTMGAIGLAFDERESVNHIKMARKGEFHAWPGSCTFARQTSDNDLLKHVVESPLGFTSVRLFV